MNGNDAAAAHFDSLARILRDLADTQIELIEYCYRARASGSFELTLGRGHDLLKFVWAGKEAILSVSFAKVASKSATPSWTHDADFSLPNPEAVYAQIASHSASILGA